MHKKSERLEALIIGIKVLEKARELRYFLRWKNQLSREVGVAI
jgi:hypothetical protein